MSINPRILFMPFFIHFITSFYPQILNWPQLRNYQKFSLKRIRNLLFFIQAILTLFYSYSHLICVILKLINKLLSVIRILQINPSSSKQISHNNYFITLNIQIPYSKMKPQDHKKTQVTHQKDNKSFMLKFKDKHSVISKQGLLKLLQKKPKSQQLKTEKVKNNDPEMINVKSQDRLVEKKKIEEIIKARSVRKGSEVSVSKSVQLPQIHQKQNKIAKSVSTSLNLRKQVNSSPSPKIQTDSIPRPSKKPPSSLFQSKPKKQAGYNFQLDQFALDHLDFLDKFQERIKKRQGASPQLI